VTSSPPSSTGTLAWSELRAGLPLGPFPVTVSAAANERYWRAAGAAHPTLAAGALYPPIAANLTILMFQQTCRDAMIQTRQRLVCHRVVMAGTPLVVTGYVGECSERRGREYRDVVARVAAADAPDVPVWTSTVTFTPASGFAR
jgi:hypothetical protein